MLAKKSSPFENKATAAAPEAGGKLRKLFAAKQENHSSALNLNHNNDALAILQTYEETRIGWFWSTDSDGVITYITQFVEELLGLEKDTIVGKKMTDFFEVERDEESRSRTLAFLLTRGSKFEDVTFKAKRSDEERWWKVSGRPQHDDAGNINGFHGHGMDITAQRRAEEDRFRLSAYDTLTGLASRGRMQNILETTLTKCKLQNKECTVLLVNLDRFKQINDTMGHRMGDELLKQVAERLQRFVHSRGEVGRQAGDEFQIILPNMGDRGELGAFAAEIITNISHPYSVDGHRLVVGASIGVAINPFDGENADDIIRNADLALNAAKNNGRGRFSFFSSALHRMAEDKHQIEEMLRDALANGELRLFYQPLVNGQTNEVACFEALMRWEHPERGMISPATFIPIAEESKLIVQMGEWAIRKACEDAVQWPGKVRVAVNVSPLQFASDSLPKVVANALAHTGLKPDRLELEITEGVFLAESAETDNMFKTLKDLGVRLALDDFGTGYSSLGYLKSAPFDKIKIDQSFVRGATMPGSRNGAIISAIVALAEALDMDTTAEGIESLDQLELIRDLRVKLIQGYVYSRPIEQEYLLEKFATGDWKIEPAGPSHQREERRSMYRRADIIHDNHRYPVIIRNLSATGALIEGIMDVPMDEQFILDFGDGQLAPAYVVRTHQAQQGLLFNEALVDDGNDGLCTRKRISPKILALLTEPPAGTPHGYYLGLDGQFHAIEMPKYTTVADWKKKQSI